MKISNVYPLTQSNLHGTQYIDGRPCFSPDGQTVLFERADSLEALSGFFTVPLDQPDLVSLLYKSDNYSCLRAAWSWNPKQKNNQIAFTGITKGRPSKVMLLTPGDPNNSATVVVVPGYEYAPLSYPAWYPNSTDLLITDYKSNRLLKISEHGTFIKFLTPENFMAGMGTINATDPDTIAYAGQHRTAPPYNQFINQIWIQQGYNDPALFSSNAEGAIGRAPWFDPNGERLTYEAIADSGNMQIFLKKVKEPYQKAPVIQVSHKPGFAQHAKFSPDGKKMVWVQQFSKSHARIMCGTID